VIALHESAEKVRFKGVRHVPSTYAYHHAAGKVPLVVSALLPSRFPHDALEVRLNAARGDGGALGFVDPLATGLVGGGLVGGGVEELGEPEKT
jgi:hypothetical protein